MPHSQNFSPNSDLNIFHRNSKIYRYMYVEDSCHFPAGPGLVLGLLFRGGLKTRLSFRNNWHAVATHRDKKNCSETSTIFFLINGLQAQHCAARPWTGRQGCLPGGVSGKGDYNGFARSHVPCMETKRRWRRIWGRPRFQRPQKLHFICVRRSGQWKIPTW